MHENPTSTPIFRTVDVAKDVPITLGEPLSKEARALMKPIGPLRYQLRPGTYADAEQIDVQLTSDELVEQMDFKYDNDPTYPERVKQFEAELGPPTSPHGGDEEVTVWRDDITEFRLMGNASGSRSMLINRAPTS
jgi:hypothetical protein